MDVHGHSMFWPLSEYAATAAGPSVPATSQRSPLNTTAAATVNNVVIAWKPDIAAETTR